MKHSAKAGRLFLPTGGRNGIESGGRLQDRARIAFSKLTCFAIVPAISQEMVDLFLH
jgi:hypothetical protein